jgi:F0F1-type ATP synthase assembly protein I
MSVGIEWASRISTICLYFSLPAFLGHYLDRKAGTSPAGVLLGMIVGFAVGIMQLLKIARDEAGPRRD